MRCEPPEISTFQHQGSAYGARPHPGIYNERFELIYIFCYLLQELTMERAQMDVNVSSECMFCNSCGMYSKEC